MTEPVQRAQPEPVAFALRTRVEQVEEGLPLAPRFNTQGLITCATTDADTGELLTVGYRSGFDRTLDLTSGTIKFVEDRKTFDPQWVCGDAPNPTVF